jgi:hypothetical protein
VATPTADTVAVKVALVAPAATVTEAGTVTAVALLASVTTCPLLPAAAPTVTVQESVPTPVIDAFEQLSELGATVSVVGAGVVTGEVPLPLLATTGCVAPQPARVPPSSTAGMVAETAQRQYAPDCFLNLAGGTCFPNPAGERKTRESICTSTTS